MSRIVDAHDGWRANVWLNGVRQRYARRVIFDGERPVALDRLKLDERGRIVLTADGALVLERVTGDIRIAHLHLAHPDDDDGPDPDLAARERDWDAEIKFRRENPREEDP